MTLLIDTNVFVSHLRNFRPAIEFFELIYESENVLFSAITESELLTGKECNQDEKRDALLHFLYNWTKVPVTNQIAMLAGDISRKYGLEVADAIIAATAIINNAELVTKNIRDFKKVAGLNIKEPY